MATQTQFLNTVLDRLEKQISKTAILQDQIEREEKRASVWEERALKAERALREEEGHSRILEHERDGWRRQASTLASKLEDALLIIEPLTLDDVSENVCYQDMAREFLVKWSRTENIYGLVELYPQEVSVNGK